MEQHLSGPWQGDLDTGFVRVRLAFRLDLDDGLAHLRTREFGELALPLGGEGDRIAFSAPKVDIALDLAPEVDSLAGVCRHGAARFPIRFHRHAPARVSRSSRAQTPQPPFPYEAEEVSFEGADGTKRAGTLTRPAGVARGAVVLSNWYGRTGRDQTTAGHKPFAIWADALTRRGFASLRFDKRGAGASGGDFNAATTADLAQDLARAVAWLRDQPGVDPARIGLLGHSEGGHLSAEVAAADPKIAFCVMMTPTGARDEEALPTDLFLAVRAVGGEPVRASEMVALGLRLFAVERSGGDLDDIMAQTRAVLEAAVAQGLFLADRVDARTALVASPWRRHWLAYDHTAALRRLACPALAVFAERDLQTPPATHGPRIRAALAQNPRATVLELPGLNHFLQTAVTGAPSEYGAIEETLAPAAIAAVCDWIEQAAPA
jgi:pimeloyl-ACP methyl ester carboxylesterase